MKADYSFAALFVQNYTQMFPFVRKDSSDSKAAAHKKPSLDVKKEKHRCAGEEKYVPLDFV